MQFSLVIQTKRGEIADEILNAGINTERTFKYGQPDLWKRKEKTFSLK